MRARALRAASTLPFLLALTPLAGGSAAGAGRARAVAPCDEAQTRIRPAGVQGAAGTVYNEFAIANVGHGPCSLRGVPRVVASGPGGARVLSRTAPGPGPKTVVLAPDRRATFDVHYPQPSFFPARLCHPLEVSTLKIVLPGQSAGTTLPFERESCGKPRRFLLVDPIQAPAGR